MRIISFRVRKYRNIEDSGKIELHDSLTCVVGKNQSGKTALLRALHKFNPHRPDPYDMRREWPRGQRTTRDPAQVVCEVEFDLTVEETVDLNAIAGKEVISEKGRVLVKKNYAAEYEVVFPEHPCIFLNPLSTSTDLGPLGLPEPSKSVSSAFYKASRRCLEETHQYLKEHRFDELAQLAERHKEELEQHRASEPVPGLTTLVNEEAHLEKYVTKLDEMATLLIEQRTQYQQAHEYITNRLPTFIYMEDYKTFRGRANLNELQTRQSSQESLSDEDETFLMILQLSGLDLGTLLEQGNSGQQEVLHDRQMDLQDAAKTLTTEVAGRWGQNDYEVQFRADGQTFFTEIEQSDKDIGMIPLEEQSKGFQWFFSFDLHFMHDSEGTFEDCVLLLDEPGLHLHPGGQGDLLERLDAYADKNTLIYTTHLPFLVDLREPSRIKVIHETEAGAVVSGDLGASQPPEKLTLQAALGMRANQSYLVAERNLLVEGVHDYWIIAQLSRIFELACRPSLPSEALITAAGGASEIVHLATFMIGQQLNVVALFDSDAEGVQAEEKLRKRWLTQYKHPRAKTLLLGGAIGLADSLATIEDLFPEDYFLQKTREAHLGKLESRGLDASAIQANGSGPILPRLHLCFEEIGVAFNKGSVGKLIRRDLLQWSTVEDLPTGLEEKAARLLEALSNAFGPNAD